MTAPKDAPAVASEGAATPEQRRDRMQMISHDIKNHLSVILGFVELLRERELDTTDAAGALDRIESNAREAVNLTISFLRAEEVDGEGLRVHRTEASLNQLVETIVRQQQARARLLRIGIQVHVDPAAPTSSIDVAMLGRALTNLIDNALQHSPKGSTIHVATRRHDAGLSVTVRDRGSGVPAGEISTLFERFGRGAGSANDTSTGLGLYIARSMVEAHGGTISVRQPPDGGMEFTIFLPLRAESRDEC